MNILTVIDLIPSLQRHEKMKETEKKEIKTQRLSTWAMCVCTKRKTNIMKITQHVVLHKDEGGSVEKYISLFSFSPHPEPRRPVGLFVKG